jgi:membrane protease YdiL (CAAX protease family)
VDAQSFAVSLMGLQLSVGGWLWLNRWWNRTGHHEKNFTDRLRWSPPPGHFAALFLLSLGIIFLLPGPLNGCWGDALPEASPLIGGCLAQCALAALWLGLSRCGSLAYARNCSPVRLSPWQLAKGALLHYLYAAPIVFLCLSLGFFLLIGLQRLGLPVSIEPQELVLLLRNQPAPLTVASLFLAAALIAPIGEELLFRGALYRFLNGHYGSRGAAWGTALTFSLIHGNAAAFFPILALSLLLTSIYKREGNLPLCMAVHGLFNANSILLSLWGSAS